MNSNPSVEYMLKNDAFSHWLGLKLIECRPGFVKLEMKVRKEMLNGFHILHGGVSFALADSAMAFAANTHGQLSVVTDAHIQFPNAARQGAIIQAVARESQRSRRKGFYEVEIRNKKDELLIAKYQGSVYVTDKPNPPKEGED